ncbi:MAG: HAMP domain-containing sensor histidine kinase [Oscillospiraceae bacterium]
MKFIHWVTPLWARITAFVVLAAMMFAGAYEGSKWKDAERYQSELAYSDSAQDGAMEQITDENHNLARNLYVYAIADSVYHNSAYSCTDRFRSQAEAYLLNWNISANLNTSTISGEFADNYNYYITCDGKTFTNMAAAPTQEQLSSDQYYSCYNAGYAVIRDSDAYENRWQSNEDCTAWVTSFGAYTLGACWVNDFNMDNVFENSTTPGLAGRFGFWQGSDILYDMQTDAQYYLHTSLLSSYQLDDSFIVDNGEEDEDYPDTENISAQEQAIIQAVYQASYKKQITFDALTVYAAPKDSYIAAKIASIQDKYDTVQNSKTRMMVCGGIICLAGLYLLATAGYSRKERKFRAISFDRVYAELMIIAGVLVFVIINSVYDDYFHSLYSFYSNKDGASPVFAGILTACGLAGVALILSLSRRLKARCFLRSLGLPKVFRYLMGKLTAGMIWLYRNVKSGKTKKMLALFILRDVIFIPLAAILVLLAVFDYDAIAYSLCFLAILAVLYVALNVRDYRAVSKLSEQIEQIHGGNTGETVEETSVLHVASVQLSEIAAGMKTNIDKQVRAERMKVELVTNVSHDLKTPLTSIISYIDLLQKEDLPDAARDYVQVLEKKSDRLKNIVADLFDLAKAASGVEIERESLDAVVLLNQIIADMDDKIRESGRELRIQIVPETAHISGDGKRLYRVFQNLIDNALKYSLKGTRIFIKLTTEAGLVHIAIKNTSSYEIKFTADEITERFNRADASRSEDGNGLGLSIAKSFTEACGGTFRITIDGDLFVAETSFPAQSDK